MRKILVAATLVAATSAMAEGLDMWVEVAHAFGPATQTHLVVEQQPSSGTLTKVNGEWSYQLRERVHADGHAGLMTYFHVRVRLVDCVNGHGRVFTSAQDGTFQYDHHFNIHRDRTVADARAKSVCALAKSPIKQ